MTTITAYRDGRTTAGDPRRAAANIRRRTGRLRTRAPHEARTIMNWHTKNPPADRLHGLRWRLYPDSDAARPRALRGGHRDQTRPTVCATRGEAPGTVAAYRYRSASHELILATRDRTGRVEASVRR